MGELKALTSSYEQRDFVTKAIVTPCGVGTMHTSARAALS
jgi:hypothetical protein